MGPYSVGNAILCGCCVFAASHLISIWNDNRKDQGAMLLALSAIISAVQGLIVIAIASTNDVSQSQLLVNLRTSNGCLFAVSIIWNLTQILNRPPRWFAKAASVALAALAIIGFFHPFSSVTSTEQLVLPWGELVALPIRSTPGLLAAPIYLLIMIALIFAMVGAVRVLSSNRILGRLMLLACTLLMLSIFAGFVTDIMRLKLPYVGGFGGAGWLLVMYWSFTHEYRVRLQRLIDSENRFAVLFRTFPDAVYIMRLIDGTIVDANPAFERMLGWSREETLGRKVPDLGIWIPEIREQIVAQLRQNEVILDMEVAFRRKNGESGIGLLSRSLVEVSGKSCIQVVIRDISERKQAEDARKKLLEREQSAREKAEELNQIKDQFLAVCSHELRTPLTPILGFARILRASQRDESAQRGLEIIERNAKIEARLVDDLLDVSGILSGKLKLQLSRANFLQIINNAIDSVGPAAAAKAIRIDVALDPTVGEITADATRLQQIVWNLLSNAAKFTPQGGQIRVKLERADSGVKLIVEDNGEGISPEFLPHVFELFRQADSSSTRVHRGLGLGMAIVKNLVEMHGGTICVESPGVGEGATFTVLLPRNKLPAEAPTVSDGKHPEHSLRGLRIMVVDDEPDTCDFLEMALRPSGATVITASSAREALSLLEQNPADVLVSDIAMHEEDGYGLIKNIRALNSQLARIPAIALTAGARQEDRLKALAAGFQEFMVKPIEPNELVRLISAVVVESTTSEKP
jgi:PAS domain S-box-containing protein